MQGVPIVIAGIAGGGGGGGGGEVTAAGGAAETVLVVATVAGFGEIAGVGVTGASTPKISNC